MNKGQAVTLPPPLELRPGKIWDILWDIPVGGMGLEYGMGLEDLSSHIFLKVWDRDLVGYPSGMGC